MLQVVFCVQCIAICSRLALPLGPLQPPPRHPPSNMQNLLHPMDFFGPGNQTLPDSLARPYPPITAPIAHGM